MRKLLVTIVASILVTSCMSDNVESTITTVETTSSTVETTTTTTATTLPETSTTAPTVTEEFPVYFFFDGFPVEPGPYLAPMARTGTVEIGDALAALLAGPTEAEKERGLSSPIPEGTSLLGVEVVDGVAAIDLSAEFESGGGSLSVLGRVAQVVFTATWFDDVDAVDFLIDGVAVDVLTGEGLVVDRPQTRDDYVDLVPAVFVDEPFWGSAVRSPVNLSGIALTASGLVRYVVVDADGLIIAEGDITTVAGERTDFVVAVDVPAVPHPGLGSIIVFELGADGNQLHVLEYPLTITE
ncbi:hypothetical protein BH23ACT4_BH23ACT4_07310 [soil metagenome]